jgi:peptidoglycan/LPS O-acetylase OafA/YrhL
MGLFRLYLAFCVVATHSEPICGVRFHGGREAVQIFFIISGFYMQLVLAGGKYTSVANFYKSRAIRIYYPYYCILIGVILISVACGLTTGHYLSLSSFIAAENYGQFGFYFASLSNFTLFFQDWIMFLEHPLGGSFGLTSKFCSSAHPLWHLLWIPQAWSVGLELTFYLLAPFAVRRCSSSFLFFTLICSFIARIATYRLLGNAADPWTYRFFPFELSHFLMGILAARHLSRFDRFFPSFSRLAHASNKVLLYITIATVLFCTLFVHQVLFQVSALSIRDLFPGAAEVLYLMSMSIWSIIIIILFAVSKDLSLDRSLGELSYPVYLVHLVVIDFVSTVGQGWVEKPMIGDVSAFMSLIVAVILYLTIFRRFERSRQRYKISVSEKTFARM